MRCYFDRHSARAAERTALHQNAKRGTCSSIIMGGTGFDSSLEAQRMSRWFVASLKRDQNNKRRQGRSRSRGLIDRERLTLTPCYGGKRGQQAGEIGGATAPFVNRFRGRSGAGSASAHGLAPQNLSPDKHVDVRVDSVEDRGSTPLASSPESFRACHAVALAKADLLVNDTYVQQSKPTRGARPLPKLSRNR